MSAGCGQKAKKVKDPGPYPPGSPVYNGVLTVLQNLLGILFQRKGADYLCAFFPDTNIRLGYVSTDQAYSAAFRSVNEDPECIVAVRVWHQQEMTCANGPWDGSTPILSSLNLPLVNGDYSCSPTINTSKDGGNTVYSTINFNNLVFVPNPPPSLTASNPPDAPEPEQTAAALLDLGGIGVAAASPTVFTLSPDATIASLSTSTPVAAASGASTASPATHTASATACAAAGAPGSAAAPSASPTASASAVATAPTSVPAAATRASAPAVAASKSTSTPCCAPCRSYEKTPSGSSLGACKPYAWQNYLVTLFDAKETVSASRLSAGVASGAGGLVVIHPGAHSRNASSITSNLSSTTTPNRSLSVTPRSSSPPMSSGDDSDSKHSFGSGDDDVEKPQSLRPQAPLAKSTILPSPPNAEPAGAEGTESGCAAASMAQSMMLPGDGPRRRRVRTRARAPAPVLLACKAAEKQGKEKHHRNHRNAKRHAPRAWIYSVITE